MIIKCLVKDSLDLYKFDVFIYECNNLVYQTLINNKTCLNFKGEINKTYKVVIKNCYLYPFVICKNVLCNNNCINFIFSKYCNRKKKSKRKLINLTDKYYPGLKIEKGEIILWQNNI